MNVQLQARLQPVLTWWGERNGRERLLVLASATAAVLVGGDALLTAPLERRLKANTLQLQDQQAQLEKLRADNGTDADAQQQRALAARLQQRVQAATAATQALRLQAADAARLPETLRAITATVGSARLLSLDLAGDTGGTATASGPSGPAGPPGTNPPANPARLYRLPITLKVSGTYEELHMLLTQIERQAEALQWSQLTLDSSGWPAIQLTLKAHVLSADPRWGATS
jgi:type II secretory pathway component PulM